RGEDVVVEVVAGHLLDVGAHTGWIATETVVEGLLGARHPARFAFSENETQSGIPVERTATDEIEAVDGGGAPEPPELPSRPEPSPVRVGIAGRGAGGDGDVHAHGNVELVSGHPERVVGRGHA